MKVISDDLVEAMAHTIQHSENIGSCFINDDDAVERVKEAVQILGVDNGIEWSISVMRKAVELQSELLFNEPIDINEELYALYSLLEHTAPLPSKQMYEGIQRALKIINALRKNLIKMENK